MINPAAPTLEHAFTISLELTGLRWVTPSPMGAKRGAVYVASGTIAGPRLSGKVVPMSGGDFPLVRAAAEQGLGIALLPESVCCAALSSGRLEVILPEWSPPQGVVHCVYPSRRGVLPAVRVLIDWLAEKMPEAIRSNVPGI